ncbi:MAG: magnesium transporter CorA family protein [Hyphomicrobiaceae bacterium]
MLTVYEPAGDALKARADGELVDKAIWIDLIEPTEEEERAVEAYLNLDLPTRAETREIEDSSRLYAENGAHFMTAMVLYNQDTGQPLGATLTFILTEKTLVTIRYHKPRAIGLFATRAEKGEVACNSTQAVLVGIVEALINRSADVIERAQDRVEQLSQHIFDTGYDTGSQTKELSEMLRSIGALGNTAARLEECAFSLERLLLYLGAIFKDRKDSKATVARTKASLRDIRSLTEQLRFLSDRITFLLDATLGAINIQQNQIMKIFSLVAVTLTPPTLIGAIYGMNFKHMPELEWYWGYPMCLVLMLASAIIPYLFIRHKGWL